MEESRQLEKELETSLLQAEKRNKELDLLLSRTQSEVENLRVSYKTTLICDIVLYLTKYIIYFIEQTRTKSQRIKQVARRYSNYNE